MQNRSTSAAAARTRPGDQTSAAVTGSMDAAAAATLRKRPLSVHTAGSDGTAAATGAREHGELVSPSARLVEDFYIVVVIGVATPVDLPAARAGIEAQLARYPRFRSIQVRIRACAPPRRSARKPARFRFLTCVLCRR